MKKLIYIFTVAAATLLFSGCYDRGIVDVKDFDHSLPDVTGLSYAREGAGVRLSWTIPSDVSPAFRRPLEVSIQKVEDDIYREIIIVHGETTSSHVIGLDSSKKYRFVVKLSGYLLDEARETGKPDRVLSDGQVIEIQ